MQNYEKPLWDTVPADDVAWTVKPYDVFMDDEDRPRHLRTFRRGYAILVHAKSTGQWIPIPLPANSAKMKAVMKAPLMSCWESSPISSALKEK